MMQNLCFMASIHYFGLPNFRKWFRKEINNSTSLDPNDVWECFGAFCKPFWRKMMQNLWFWPEFTISGYRTCEDGFATKSTILPHWTTNDVSVCFGAFRKPMEHKMMLNLSFGPQCTILGYRTCETSFAAKSTILPHWTQNDVSEHFANLWNIKWCKTWVSGHNALFLGTKLAKMVSQRNLPFYPVRSKTMLESAS